VHVEAIPEDAAYIGYPAFKFVFSFDPALGKCRQDEGLVEGSDEAELVQRLRKLETGAPHIESRALTSGSWLLRCDCTR
jgi:hypothetical protein